MGDNKVIHFTRGGEEIGTRTILDKIALSSTPTHSKINCKNCGDNVNDLHGVIQSCLDCFFSGGDLYLFHYSVSMAFFLTKVRGGTCTLADSEPPQQVLSRANYLLRNGFGNYNIFKNNCEDFSWYCKIGLMVKPDSNVGHSGQISSIVAAASTITSSREHPGYGSVFQLLFSAGKSYLTTRVESDVLMRQDVVRIPVEMLSDTYASMLLITGFEEFEDDSCN